jgi:hypothetical protein
VRGAGCAGAMWGGGRGTACLPQVVLRVAALMHAVVLGHHAAHQLRTGVVRGGKGVLHVTWEHQRAWCM